ncbi:putative membrane protein YphA (DoxX/SURF4 family) [Ancylomarina subtilis]|uniref:Putative membrane protein YphA (DoxX/SURF4 family) n=1 Tax=Ancylomarina subtilis TaxID=1639035 RepID=A0A4Q7VIG9_9BACT|nr:BT_3928 family protein [Ancylomarina subtilis]RZT95909.1 putative membrane protein YphA (DoxX/SURF4 family) [Ancylomarina subtilis]
MSLLRSVSRLLVGSLFIFSGFVKAIDPMGSTFKFKDYFLAFGMDSLTGLAFTMAIILSTLEFSVGMLILFNVYKKSASWLALLFMLFFTPLTLILALTNPVTDCGCFGDALILTNWETFGKNIIILAFTLVVFYTRKLEKDKSSKLTQNLLLAFSLTIALGCSYYSYRHLPFIDFRPYHIGANIQESMTIPEGAPADEYQSIFKYEKNGVIKEFDESNYPWQDSSWTYVDVEQIKIKEGYKAPIHDFSISNEESGDITEQVLNDASYTFLLVSRQLNEMKLTNLKEIDELAAWCRNHKYNFICLTASTDDEINTFKEKNNAFYDFYATDEIQLKTIIRSNPGLVLLQNGTILNKWHWRDIPKTTEIKANLAAYSITQHQTLTNKLVILSITTTLLLLIGCFLILKFRFKL